MTKRLALVCARISSALKLHRKSRVPLSARNDLFRVLNVNKFSDGEIKLSFDKFKPLPTATHVCPTAAKSFLRRGHLAGRQSQEVDKFIPVIFSNGGFGGEQLADSSSVVSVSVGDAAFIDPVTRSEVNDATDDEGITLPEYKSRLRELAERLDPRVWPIAASFFLTGTSLGIVVPCMPLLVSELSITPSQFGFVISSFALAKLISNIPSTHYVDIVGRKPLMVAGLGMCALGLSGIGVSLYPGFGYPWIILCRVVSGVGVSAFVSGSFMYLIDISTQLNRARTNAPPSAGFNAGLALGPAMGGFLVEFVGISSAYFIVGGMFAGLALLNQAIIKETFRGANQSVQVSVPVDGDKAVQQKLSDAFKVAYDRWKELFTTNPDVRNVLLLNTSYWFTLSGAQLTLLPLLMVGPTLNLSVSQIAMCFGMMSITSFLLSQPLASLCDKYDKVYVSCGGCTLLATSCLTIPYVSSFYELLGALVPLAIGSTIINTAPTAHMANICTEKDRSQAVSLLRTVGDIGFLCGATTAGIFGALTSVETAMTLTGALLLASSAVVGRRHKVLLAENVVE